MTPVVFLACPRYGGVAFDMALGVMQCARDAQVMVRSEAISVLTMCFNVLWAEALNRRTELGLTHFAMLHSDIGPPPWWLDTMLARLTASGAQLLSAAVPIKDERALTSTALLNRERMSVRRLSLREVHRMPEIFTAADTPWPEQTLLVNTGLWVCDFTQAWVEQVRFDTQNTIVRLANGRFEARVFPEDWDFSVQLHNLGVPIAATRLGLSHFGVAEYTSDAPWGDETDTHKEVQLYGDDAHQNGAVDPRSLAGS